MSGDDRAEFEATKRSDAARMAGDAALQADALALNVAADRYDWSYQWSWLGLPVIQMPPDIVVLQEIIWETKPQLIIETGIARGGSLILSASILQLLGDGEVLGIDIDIRAHNRAAIEAHPLAHRITMIEGSSLDPEVVGAARARADAVERVMVVLDSNHTHEHVLAELELFAPAGDRRAVPRRRRHVRRRHPAAGASPPSLGSGQQPRLRARRVARGRRRGRRLRARRLRQREAPAHRLAGRIPAENPVGATAPPAGSRTSRRRRR